MPPLSVLGLGVVTALANLLGGLLVVANRRPSERLLLAFMGFGGGFLLGAAFLEMVPESLKGGAWASLLVVTGYLAMYAIESLFAQQAHGADEAAQLSHSHNVAHLHGTDGHILEAAEGRHHIHPPTHTLSTEFPGEGQFISRSASVAALVGGGKRRPGERQAEQKPQQRHCGLDLFDSQHLFCALGHCGRRVESI